MSLMRTLPQAIVWGCTRSVDAVSEIQNYPIAEQLVVAMHQYRGGIGLPQWRERLDEDEIAPIGQPVGRLEYPSNIALSELTAALLKGYIRVHISQNASFKSLELAEIIGLRLRVGELSEASCAFWDKTLSSIVHVEPRFCQEDLERLWPALRLSALTKIADVILEALLAATEDGPITKQAALELAETIPGYRRRMFERLWRDRFPPDRKFRRGQRRPKRIAA